MAHLTSYPDQKAHQRYFVVKSESLYIRTSPVRDDQHQKQSMISKAMHDRVIDLLTIRIANWNLRKALANTREFLTKHWVHVWHVKWYGFGMSFTHSLKFFLTTINKGISTLTKRIQNFMKRNNQTPAIVNVCRSGMKGKIPFYSLVAKAWEQSGTKYKKKILFSYTGFKRHTS